MVPKSIDKIQSQIKNGDYSLTEYVKQYIKHIEADNEDINAFVELHPEAALKKASEIDQKIKQGTAGPLAGAVTGIKMVLSQRGKKTTCASSMLKDFEAVYDATAVKRLKNDDAIILGELNMDEFAMGSSNENSIYGPARNPHDTSKVTGGSSGGSAAAVAANFANVTLGTDTGGSIRQPASYCGVVGLKPTYGRVSRYGLVAYASSFDCVGPLASNVYDAALTLNTLAGSDPNDGTCSNKNVPDYTQTVRNPTSNIKIGIAEEYFGEGLDEEIKFKLQDRLSDLENDGVELVPIHLPHMKYAIAAYYILATAEASSNLARYDGIRYGHRADIKEVEEELKAEEAAIEEQITKVQGGKQVALAAALEEIDTPLIRLYKKSRTEGFGPEVKRRIMLGTYVLSSGYYDAYYAKAQRVRRLIKQDFTQAFSEVDVIVSPTAPTTAFDIGSNLDNPLQMYLNDIYTISANLAGICGINIPAGVHSNGLPIGMQFMGNAFDEQNILNAARLIELQNG